ncbi:hypothetical protein FLX08_06050 [Microbispora hainanensis]|uniref:Peptidase S26 domain-containing protein n=2 Tax=Microbispora hainanensis TaxID=568844 RepID=A0A544Z1W2_9ACTN|nr:hypothetical protein FLX08_06050 [Microbispora hainanensis]
MYPALLPGDRVVFDRTRRERLRIGDVVLLRVPEHALPSTDGFEDLRGNDHAYRFVKRVVALGGQNFPPGIPGGGRDRLVPEGTVVVLGESMNSLDSRQWGAVPHRWVYAVARFSPAESPGRRREIQMTARRFIPSQKDHR